jgi:outer membrane protein assembly factor BamB
VPTRRELLKGAAAAGLAGTVWPAVLDAAPAPADWPSAAQGPRGHRWVPDAVAEQAQERWRVRLAGGIPGAPASVGGIVYAASYGGEVVAVELATGKELWRVELPLAAYGDSITIVGSREVGFFGGPAVHGGRVFAASDRMYALDARTGARLWTAPAPGSADSDDYFWGPPLVTNGLVLAGSGSGSELPRARGALHAYDVETGAPRWIARTVPEGGNGGGVIVPPTIDKGRAYVVAGAPYEAVEGDNPGTCALVEIRLSDGAITWSDQVHPAETRGRDLNSAPVLLGDHVYATAKDGVYAWDRRRRTRLWHRQLTPDAIAPGQGSGPYDGPEFGPLASDGRRLYVLSNDVKGANFVAAALEPADGAVVWETRVPGLAFAAPAIAGPSLWTATAAGLLHRLDLQDGTLQQTLVLGEPSAGAASSSRKSVVVGTGNAPYLPGESLVCVR